MPTNDSDSTKKRRGGPRPNSGRPPKQDKDNYVQVTCVLRKDTVAALKAGAGGKEKFFGQFLQFHLDRFPVPTNEEYLAIRDVKPHYILIKRRKVPVIFAGKVGVARANLKKPPKPKKKSRLDTPAFRQFLRELASGKTK